MPDFTEKIYYKDASIVMNTNQSNTSKDNGSTNESNGIWGKLMTKTKIINQRTIYLLLGFPTWKPTRKARML